VGPELAKRVEATLGAKTLDEVYAAAWDGRLRRVPGLGNKRLRAIRKSLATRLQADVPLPSPLPDHEPPIAELLALDLEYLQQSGKNRLPRAIPRLFNPTGRAWLPILRTTRGVRRYTVRFANTARTHESGHLGDWVIITCETKQWYGQWTVMTAQYGDLRGQRIVLHREADCRDYYRQPRQQELPFS
jgi:putative hydrolase